MSNILFLLVAGPGYPFAWLLDRMGVNMGAGSGEGGYYIWSLVFGTMLWVLVIAGVIFWWQHITFTFTP